MVAILGLLKANFKTSTRYSIDWWGSIISPLFTILPSALIVFYSSKRGILPLNLFNIKSIYDYIKYMLIGVCYWGYVEVLWSTIFMLRDYMKIGQFEDIFASPLKASQNILGWSIMGISRVTIESLPLIFITVFINIVNISLINFILIICTFIVSILASFGMTFIIFGITLIFKDGDQLASLIGNSAPFLCGLYFPVTLLPLGLKQISYVFPFTWGIDIIRNLLLNTNTILNFKYEFILLFVFSLIYITFGIIIYKKLEFKARKIGVKGF